MDFELKNKVAIVTGSGSGIGTACAKALANEGVSVVIADLNADAAGQVCDEIVSKGQKAIAVQLDVSSAEQVESLVNSTVDAFGSVDILVNNAGITKDNYIVNMSEDEWDSVIDIDLKGQWLCSRAVGKIMMDQKWGRIVNISSRALYGNKGQSNYSSAKAGVIGLTGALAIEFGKFNVTVNAIAPGFILTDMVQKSEHFETIRKRAETYCKVSRLGVPEDIAFAVLYFASEHSAYVTGETLHVSGGRFSA
jgi:3-oxoacyl-[acyl-carrier protein] reductase